MSRPAGEIRQTVLQASADLVRELQRGVTLGEITARAMALAPVARHSVRACVGNCARSGALQIVGEQRRTTSGRPPARYLPAFLASMSSTCEGGV
jgi:hypothetical protein